MWFGRREKLDEMEIIKGKKEGTEGYKLKKACEDLPVSQAILVKK